MKQNPTKKQLVLNHLQLHGHIEPLQAMFCYNCYRLADVVFRLKKEHDIITEIVQSENSRHAKYIYLGRKNENN